jgi:hypothetical protein
MPSILHWLCRNPPSTTDEQFAHIGQYDTLCDPRVLIEKPDQVFTKIGFYAWYFRILPPRIPTAPYYSIDNAVLLYFGITGLKKKAKTPRNLRKRIVGEHLGNDSYASTLRRSLAFLLHDTLGLSVRLKRPGGTAWWLGAAGEQLLTDWICEHARVMFVPYGKPKSIETQVVANCGHLLPLNISRDNRRISEFGRRLRDERRNWVKQALTNTS